MAQPEKLTWVSWVNDPNIDKHGLTFDRTPARAISAPAGRFRVCAYHVDFDERPTCYVDVGTLAEAAEICENLGDLCGWNVDYAVAFDDQGNRVHGGG